jgi:tetraacyldisaccharide-1-P 4'-kinase
VISVGNISSGGRGKTPWVIFLAQEFKQRGWIPVVLSRGYGRKSKKLFFVPPLKDASAPELDPLQSGDEPLEIAALAQCDVAVASNRFYAATEWLKHFSVLYPLRKTIFILDDGFQHWSLQRDFDLVLISKSDLSDETLPVGRLRESPDQLERADLVMTLDQDYSKSSEMLSTPAPGARVGFLTTRARESSTLPENLRSKYPGALVVSLHDHASPKHVLEVMKKAPVTDWLIGGKEAVKIIPTSDLSSFFESGFYRMHLDKRPLSLHWVKCQLNISNTNALQPLFLAMEAALKR